MSRFKIGQRVVAVKDQSQGRFKKGDEFTIDGFTCCPHCGIQCVYLDERTKIIRSLCGICDNRYNAGRQNYAERLFAPLQSFGEQIEESISKEAEEFATWAIEAIQTKP